jgi:DNA-binding SARP family transcriptional activator/DNA-binding CsgD family transcriptional regulator
VSANGDSNFRIEVLGPVRASCGQLEITLGPTRQRAVFAILAMRAGQSVTRAELVSAVWGRRAPASVDGSIHTYISGLRRALEPHRPRWSASTLLTSDPAGYTLRIEPECVDATAFERLIGHPRGRRSDLSAAAAAEAVRALDEALSLWRGEPLSGLPGPFAERERVRLDELRLAALEQRAEAVLTLGEYDELGAELTALVQQYPLRERLRELLMLALYRGGQPAEALEVFRDARAKLVEELGVEPGAGLQRLHARVLAQDPALDPRPASPASGASKNKPGRLFVLPAQVARRLGSGVTTAFVGRSEELRRLRALVDNVCDGRGGAAWVEGDFGIGKSELLAAALWDLRGRGCQLGWAMADELSARIPLRAMVDCLGIDGAFDDPRRAALTSGLSGHQAASNVWSGRDPALATAGRMLALVDELCSQAPLVLVVDDMQWADEASVLLWHRLTAATRQLPLLLIAAARPVPRSTQLVRLRQAIESRDGDVLNLSPLTGEEALELEKQLVGAQPGPELRDLVERTIGNPLYITELTEALVREHALRTTAGVADLADSSTYTAPRSLVDTISRHLDVLSGDARETLRWAALLGTEFTVTDIAAVAGKRPSDLMAVFDETVAANVIVDSDTHLAFRHPLLRQAFYDGIPAGARAGLHRQAAEALSLVGASVSRVAEQVAATPIADPWVLQWLVDNHKTVSNRAPLIAADLLARALEACTPHDPRREILAAALVRVLFRLDRHPEDRTRAALALATDPARAAEMRTLLATMQFRRGDTSAAILTLSTTVDDLGTPVFWRQRQKHLLADFRRGGLDDLDAAEAAGHKALSTASAEGDSYLTAHALQTLWLVDSVRRDHEAALAHVDKAIAVVESGDEFTDLALDLLDNRVFTCQNLDRLSEADESLRAARSVASRHALPADLRAPAAVHCYWVGRWNEAMAELDSVTEDGPAITFYGIREAPMRALLLHGVAALIAGRRGDRVQAAAHLNAVEEYAPVSGPEREHIDFLLVAQALALEQQGHAERALVLLEPLLDPGFSPMLLPHQWLPALVRLSVEAGDLDRARRAVRICDDEAAKERVAARAAAAAQWCHGLVDNDPARVLAAAGRYRRAGRVVELGTALEDAAVLLARRGDLEAAGAAFTESTRVYTKLSAGWDLQRADTRLAEFGIRRSTVPTPPQHRRGWESLSPVEIDIARLVAGGYSNPAIAVRLGLPSRTVQAHISRLFGKLDTTSRDRVAEEITT